MVLLLAGALSTSVLFATDAFFAYAGWRIRSTGKTWCRASIQRLHARTEKREPFFAALSIAVSLALALTAGPGHPRVACVAVGALVALIMHMVLYVKTAFLIRQFETAPVGSAEWHSRAGRLEAAMLTRASLQAAALICIVGAGMMV